MVAGRLLIFLFSILFSSLFAQSNYNVILILTDDQGYGDVGYTGNDLIKTPNIDGLAEQAVQLSNFHVSPVCAPTRASLMTGRYSLRTGVRDTYNGGAIMSPNEVTMAEMFKKSDYRTGIFGKWHLGDNYPSRPQDQGFDETLIHLAGGMGQVGDITTYFEYDRSYFDPVLWHNGKQEKHKGYCSDIYTDAAIEFIEKSDEPFFCYLSYNAPHTPLQVAESHLSQYQSLTSSNFSEQIGHDISERDMESAKRVYAMVSNIDDNIGRLWQILEASGKDKQTIFIFMTDNGPQQIRWNADMRGRKGSVYEGGTRVPFFMLHPDISTPQKSNVFAAHIDVLPTLADWLNIDPPNVPLDGISLVPLIDQSFAGAFDRTFFSYWTRKSPVQYRNMSLTAGKYKLIANGNATDATSAFELFNLLEDPSESTNLIDRHPTTAKMLHEKLDSLLTDLTNSQNLINPPHIKIGTSFENPVYLNRNDAHGERGIWAQDDLYGFWLVDIQSGMYKITCRFKDEIPGNGVLYVEVGQKTIQQQQDIFSTNEIVIDSVYLNGYRGQFLPFYLQDDSRYFPFWIMIEKL